VCCLAEVLDKQALEAVHREAHGLVAGTIFERSPNVPLNELLGPRPEFRSGHRTPRGRCERSFTDLAGSVEQNSGSEMTGTSSSCGFTTRSFETGSRPMAGAR
jgi:hypothetical protein